MIVPKASKEHAYYTVKREELYKVRKNTISEKINQWENPFEKDSFPSMDDINYSSWFKHGVLYMQQGTREEYDRKVKEFRDKRYPLHDDTVMVNNDVVSITKPRLYNVVTSETVKNELVAHLNKDTSLVIKVVDLGGIYEENIYDRANGDHDLEEIYNEIRVGFFLNELRYTYPKCLTQHFMSVIDWFISDINLYPSSSGYGPYQYIVSEKLDIPLYKHLLKYPTTYVLKCTLFCVAQALEAAWATNKYLHYDLHYENIMLKEAVRGSEFFEKNYLYTRPYSKNTYMLARTGTFNTIVKILDFGRNRMEIPDNLDKTNDLFEHIDKDHKHEHNDSLVYDIKSFGIGLADNRTWDMRRLIWDMVTQFPIDYWVNLKNNDPGSDYIKLIAQMGNLLDITEVNTVSKEAINDVNLSDLFAMSNNMFTIESILLSKIRELHVNLKRDPEYKKKNKQEQKIYRAQKGVEYGFKNAFVLEKRLNNYALWHETVLYKHIWTVKKTLFNATSFLDSDLFTALIVKPNEIPTDAKKNAWLGERPYSDPLPLDKTY